MLPQVRDAVRFGATVGSVNIEGAHRVAAICWMLRADLRVLQVEVQVDEFEAQAHEHNIRVSVATHGGADLVMWFRMCKVFMKVTCSPRAT